MIIRSVSLSELSNRTDDGRIKAATVVKVRLNRHRKWRSLSGLDTIDQSIEPEFVKEWKLKQAGYGFLKALKRKRIRVSILCVLGGVS